MKVQIQSSRKLLVRYACIACLNAVAAWGQATNSADVSGTVTDPSGAIVPGVTVIVNDLDKNTERSLITNASGVYDTGPLVPGDRYEITFKKEGFATLRRGPMTLRVGITGLNAELGLGRTAQEVLVLAEAAPMLETTTPEISATLPKETLTQLPQVGNPDWQSFIILVPGVKGTGGSATPGMDGVSANGSMPFALSLMDGVTTNSPMSNNVINTPIFDSIGEVKISASLFSAEYGTGGVLFNQISKGGTNQFHGMGYDYLRNNALNATNFQFGLAGVKTPLHYNTVGGNIGGPVIKNRIFFFFGKERVINHSTGNLSFITVPTANLRSGNFIGMNAIYDPTAQVVNPSTGIVTRQPFPSNQIPTTMLDPVAKAIQDVYPIANLPGTVANGVTTNNYQYALPSKSPREKYFGRFDADVTKNNRITGSASWNNNWSTGVNPVAPVNAISNSIFSTNNQLSDYWTISPRTLNEFRFGFMGEYDLLKPLTLEQGWPAKLGLKFSKADIFPTISITGIYGLGPGTSANYKENLFDISDVVTLIRGRHLLHVGGDLIVMRADSTPWPNINGAGLSFTGVYTAGSNSGPLATTSGAPYADFLLGYAKSWSAFVSPEYGGRLKNPAAFVQDDFKVNRRLTLNLGLRWTGTTGWSDVHGNVFSFDPTIVNPATNTLGAMWYGVTAANGRTALQESRMNTWLPRFGFAYLIGDRTTVRGGFGVYTFPWSVDQYASNGGRSDMGPIGLGNAFTAGGNQTDSTTNAQPVVILASDGNTNYQGSKGASINSLFQLAPTRPESYNGQAVGYVQYHAPVPLLKSWNFTIQRQLSGSLMGEVSYAGSRGTNLAFFTDLNQVPEAKLAPNDAAFRPYPVFQSLTGYTTAGLSNYHALEAGITHRLSSGLVFNFNYTWSHMLSNQDSAGRGGMAGTLAYQKAYDPAANYGASNFDVRHMFKGYTVYSLPFGRARPYLNSNAIVDKVIGGWSLSGTLVAQTGNPFTPYMLVNNSYSLSSNALQFPNVVGDPILAHRSISGWFDVNAFAAPAPGTFGNMGRNPLYGPGMSSVGMSLAKSFAIWESVRFDLSGNATNVLNHPSFAQPDRVIGPGHIGKITGVTVGGRQVELIGKIRF